MVELLEPPPAIPQAPAHPPAEDETPVGRNLLVAALTLAGIILHLVMRFALHKQGLWIDVPLITVLVLGGGVLLLDLLKRVLHGNFGSDLLAGISIVTSLVLHQYLAGSLVVLMLSGGSALEAYAVWSASSVLRALAKRMPSVAHLKRGAHVHDVPLDEVTPGVKVVVLPHEVCPADGVVVEGQGNMDESFLTGEPYGVPKTPGSQVLSGAINGEVAMEIEVLRAPKDSRYESIMRVMADAEQRRPRMRRISDRLGAWYTPAAVLIAIAAWVFSGDPSRFLAVLVVATPCPLIIAIPVAIIGTISLAARRGIVIRDPGVLERIKLCRTVFFDKTGTLTYGRPQVSELLPAPGFDANEVLGLVAALEQYSRHPLAQAVVKAAQENSLVLAPATNVSEAPGHGLLGHVAGHEIVVTGRGKVTEALRAQLPPVQGGLECVALVDGKYAALFRFRDEPRADVTSFVAHLGPHHDVRRTVLLTGDRLEEAQRMAAHAGITEVFAGKSPEEKLRIVREATAKDRTLYLGDGVNDAPAMLAATAAIAFGTACDVTSEAAGAVILEPSLKKLDELLHIARRLRSVALTSAVGGMALSLVAIAFAATGALTPVYGALFQEVIDLAAVLNALRAALPPKSISHLE
jgi:heavy metal translocating P-type ATPase